MPLGYEHLYLQRVIGRGREDFDRLAEQAMRWGVQRGAAYGTLAGHPERGEELFLVEHRGDEAVTLTVRAFSRPVLWWTRAARPASRLVQRRITRRYLRALDA